MRTLLLSLILFAAPPAFAQETPPAQGFEAWTRIYEILSHPRCSNCHVGEDNRPRWSGPSYGKAYNIEEDGWTYHGMYINGDVSRIGIMSTPCSTCHQEENSDLPHGPPGSHAWALAPVEMEWFGKSSAAICNQLKDPARNGGRSLEEVAGHVNDDELVHWGWKPGPGREPAPYSRKEAVRFLETWAAAGAPCPREDQENDQ